jgi:hypothetical protein
MQPYVDAAGGDHGAALRLYEWNSAVSGALYETLGHVEVVLRNALHQALSEHHAASGRPGSWFDDPARLLTQRMRDDVGLARERLAARRVPVTPGRVVAELTFGFWRFLLAKQYEHTLWIPALSHAFPLLRPSRRTAISRRVDRLNALRNRIAHHEPIHRRRLDLDHRDVLFVARAVCDDTARWIERTSRVDLTLALRP